MDPEKIIEIQHQMRKNNADLQDFLHGLDSWETDIKTKDEELRQLKTDGETKDLPPVRNSLEKKRKKKVKLKKTVREKKLNGEGGGQKQEKKHTNYDYYSQWDRFDVDSALKDLDIESSSEEQSEEYETDEEAEVQRKLQKASLLKDRGNQLLKEGKYNEAIESYTQGIDFDPSSAILPANRGMALLKQEKYAAAEADCSMAISLDPMYVKAYARRATARCGLKKYNEAQVDFLHVLKLEPHNKHAKVELDKIEKILKPLPKPEESGIVKAVYKSPPERSKKPLRRINIEEIGIDEDIEKRKAEIKEKITQHPPKHKIETQEEASISHPGSMNDTERSSTECQTDSTLQSEFSLKASSVEDSFSKSSSISSATHSPRIPSVPVTSFQFQTDWKVLKNHFEKFYLYFKEINPEKYKQLFGEALESDMLTTIFNILNEYYTKSNEDCYLVLLHLSQVKRFAMTIMFMSRQEKKVLESIFVHMRQSGKQEEKSMEKLAKQYGL